MVRQSVEEFARDFSEIGRTIGDDFTDALSACRNMVSDAIDSNFVNARTAAGEAWPPRKDPVPTHPLLILLGDLKEAATGGDVDRIEDGHVLVFGVSTGTIVYAGVQNFGWPERNIKPRPYMGISEAIVDQCADVIVDQKVAELAA